MVVMLGQLLWQILEMETCIMTYRLVMEFTKHFITNIFCSIRSTFFLWRIIGMHPTTICTPDSNRVMKCPTEWIFLMSHPLPCYDAYIPQWDQTITHPANVAFLTKVIFEVQAVLVSPFTRLSNMFWWHIHWRALCIGPKKLLRLLWDTSKLSLVVIKLKPPRQVRKNKPAHVFGTASEPFNGVKRYDQVQLINW